MARKLLIVEDEKNLTTIIFENAKIENYECDVSYDGEDGLAKALANTYDLIILDLMLPKMDGFEICKKIRREKISTPVIMLTARAEENDKIIGFEIGADDYITKPFSVKELFVRIKAIIRRSSAETDSADSGGGLLKMHSLTIDADKCKVEKNGVPLELSKLEYELLLFFTKNPGKIFSREELLKNVWKYEDIYGERTVDTTVSRLRNKIEEDSSNPKIIQNKRGMGYYLTRHEPT